MLRSVRRAVCVLLVVLLWHLAAWSATLTEAQYDALKIDITQTHQAEFATQVAAADFGPIAEAYNLAQTPTFWVWKTSLVAKDIYEATDPDQGTWNWATYIGQSVQERDGWQTMLSAGPLNPSLAQVRDAYTKIFGGTGAAATQRAHLLAMSRRAARRGEVLFTPLTSCNGSSASPCAMAYEGQLSYSDINHALTGAPLP